MTDLLLHVFTALLFRLRQGRLEGLVQHARRLRAMDRRHGRRCRSEGGRLGDQRSFGEKRGDAYNANTCVCFKKNACFVMVFVTDGGFYVCCYKVCVGAVGENLGSYSKKM